VDPKLRDFCPNGPHITRVAANDAFNPGLHESLSPDGPKAPEPTRKLIYTANLNRNDIVAPWLREGKGTAGLSESGATNLRTWDFFVILRSINNLNSEDLGD
jgi:hypothetical protein